MKRVQLVLATLAGCCAMSAYAQRVEVSAAVQQDTLPSLAHAKANPNSRWHYHPEHQLPLPYFPKDQEDGAVQDSVFGPKFAPTFQTGVDGVGQGFTGPQGTYSVQYAPPDTVGAVGATQYVQATNVAFAVFNKSTKAVQYGPVATSTLWSGFGGQCETDNDGDATVVYDKAAQRWVISQFAVGTSPYLQCVAVSATSDATGAYYRYAFSYGTGFNDYPKMGVWPDGYYITFNIFANGSTFAGSKLCAYDRAKMLTGAAATQQCFQLSTSYGGVLPADLDGATAPPAGSPNYMVNFGTNSLNLWKFHVDWTTPANSTLSAPKNIPVAAFSPACSGGNCIPQGNSRTKLDSLADRLMYRLAYRNFGTYESLVVNHSVTVGTNKRTQSVGVRWYELRAPNAATPTVFQQSTYAPDTTFRWMGSIAQDKQGNMALGYSASSSSINPAIRYTGRLVGDPVNTMQAEANIVAGGGSQSGSNLNRWGDYSAMTVDPTDDCTFWYTTEYLKATGAFNWNTRIASFKFAGCQ